MSKHLDKVVRILNSTEGETAEQAFAKLQEHYKEHNYLYLASIAGDSAKASMADGDLDKAWGFYQEQKKAYMNHASMLEWSDFHAARLDATVSVSLAKILNLKANYHEALTHLVYWASSLDNFETKRCQTELKKCLISCDLHKNSMTELNELVMDLASSPDLAESRKRVVDLITRG